VVNLTAFRARDQPVNQLPMSVELRPQTRAPLVAKERRPEAAPARAVRAWPERRMLLAGPIVALITVIGALIATDAAGVPLRDPDHVAGRRLLLVVWMVLLLVVLDVVFRAIRRCDNGFPTLTALRDVRRERWTLPRGVAVASALIAFYATYLAYRNLKSVVPLLRPGDLFDNQLASFDHRLFGSDPAELLHSILGAGVSAQVLSFSYMLFFLFIPATLAAALVFSRDLRAGLFYVTAQSINWVLGAISYFLVPSLGPVYVEPGAFAGLPATEAGNLQWILLDQRLEFLRDPLATGTAQSIGAFASLHVSIFFTGAVAAHLLGLGRSIKILAWTLFGLTTLATIYLGWHYVADDLGGIAIGLLAIVAARALTGFDPRAARRRPAPDPAPS
jgi:hypothetical protein